MADINTTESNGETLDLLLDKIYRDGGYDFRDYKQGTVVRRLERRLQATGAKTYLDYLQFLNTNPDEYERLASTITIAVSGFFRSRSTFEQVAKLVIPELVAHKIELDKPKLRFWSAACARGEEPYSIAMMLSEFFGDRLKNFDIHIHATDINQQVLKQARAGVYSPQDVEGLPLNLLAKYFNQSSKGYTAGDCIRQMVSFSCFDLSVTIKPPFRELDCIFCCNVLIYLKKPLQGRLLSMLYEALADPGYLILGEVETPTDNLRDKLACLSDKARIYKKNGGGDDV